MNFWMRFLLVFDVEIVQQLSHEVVEDEGGHDAADRSDRHFLPVLHHHHRL